MAAPATTARATPDGRYLKDGYQTLIAPAADPDVAFWEKTVTPPGMDGGDAIDNTTMHNETWRTMRSRALVTLTDMTLTVAYDPDIYDEALALLNVETSWTVHFPDGSTLDFYGFLRLFEPQDMSEGEQPEANITISPTNFDVTNNVEAGPVMTEVAGT